ncbi:MAG: ATP-grasp domain-containing protein [Ilumatobacteraceae bacterium]
MSRDIPRVLITGAGGPAAVAAIRSLAGRAELYAVDIDPLAVGLYLVDDEHRSLVLRGDDPAFVDHLFGLAERWDADVVIPTVDSELIPVAASLARFEDAGHAVMVPSLDSLERTVDKWVLMDGLGGSDAVPATVLIDESFDVDSWVAQGHTWPAITKPRLGSGGRGVALIDSPEALTVPFDRTYILQELLPGIEISVDVLARRDGAVVAAVPRLRLKVDSGIAVAGEAIHDELASDLARAVVLGVGLTGPLNVQFKRAVDGEWKLLEINPRLPGSSPLTMAAGVDFVGLALADLLGQPLDDWYDFNDVAMVRHWEDIVIPAGEFARTELAADTGTTPTRSATK